MKPIALILLALTSGAEAYELTVREVQKPVHMCVIEKQPVGCAYLIALYRVVRDEQKKSDKGI